MSSWEQDKRHKAKLEAKYEKVGGLQALLETCEAAPEPDPDYIRDLRRRLTGARNQLKAMIGFDNE